MMRIAAGVASVLVLAIAIAVLLADVPSIDQVRASTVGSEATLYDRHGEPLHRLRVDPRKRQIDWVPLAGISPALERAILASEDRRFGWHPGIDPIAIASAARDNLVRTRARGASTITMQLAAILDGAPAGREPRDWPAKLAQMRRALAIEARWTKPQILEAYLNLVAFRGELVGVGAAARGLFGKAPEGLDKVESAVLAALVRAPGAAPARVAARACALLASDECAGAALAAAGLARRGFRVHEGVNEAPHLARRMLKQPGEAVRSSLDARVQRFARETLRRHLFALNGRNVEDGAVVVLDNATGEVLAYIGSSGALSDAPEVDGVRARRQAGSTLKPFLYALAIESRLLTAASILDDSPVAIATAGGLYAPQNYDRDFKGPVSLRTALAASLNVPAVRTLGLVGVARFRERLRTLGFETLVHDAEHYGHGLALGGADIDLLALTNAYRALANGGVATRWRLRADDPVGPPERVFSSAASFIVADMLSDATARAMTFGFASPLATRGWSAVKTGTSKAMRDNWAVGFTDRYTVGVWVGNFSGAPMWDVSGTSGAAPVWRAIIEFLHAGRASRAPEPTSDVVRRAVQFSPAIEAARDEWFIRGTELERVAATPAPVVARILAPVDGTIVAVDPDIPRERQSIVIRAAAAEPACVWLDGAPLRDCGVQPVRVPLPLPGMHRIELRDAQGAVLDSVRVEVRGVPGISGGFVRNQAKESKGERWRGAEASRSSVAAN